MRGSHHHHHHGSVEYTPWLIAGLGNPGNKYYGTRHNVGFEMVDRIAAEEGITMNTIQSKSLLGIGSIGEVPVLVVKPQSYMNYSGEAIGPLAAYYQVPLRHILLIYDDTSLPNGVLRLQKKGGHGRHNGLQNVIEHLDGRREFPRLSIGIGSPPGKMDPRAFLLQKFSSEERVQIDTALEQGVDAVRTLVLKGFSGSTERFNLVQ
uniref:CRS2 n=1 Tax=Zea mays TaxID=4577 RepID=UPI0001BEF2CB|nr:Chain A, CRS2 [Zea mays]